MHVFYTRLAQFLLAAGLEDSTTGLGCSEAELAAQEQRYGVSFPLAYRLFLTWCGRTTLQSLDQDFRLEFLDYYWDSARELLAENQATLAPGAFVFGEWQNLGDAFPRGLNDSNQIKKAGKQDFSVLSSLSRLLPSRLGSSATDTVLLVVRLLQVIRFSLTEAAGLSRP